ncbi:hypothetical protein CCUS01_16978 [Colletotrichum cuscutae]|uniref:Uncharacterized protein n=1 Tax=Colletotrichum cuscutae TaxID=1209917 RepID=A0AAI9Y2N0_9PEZI|nr:hypothetical protein CCUS01_16978 [Colletotrichum cuscutae]
MLRAPTSSAADVTAQAVARTLAEGGAWERLRQATRARELVSNSWAGSIRGPTSLCLESITGILLPTISPTASALWWLA